MALHLMHHVSLPHVTSHKLVSRYFFRKKLQKQQNLTFERGLVLLLFNGSSMTRLLFWRYEMEM